MVNCEILSSAVLPNIYARKSWDFLQDFLFLNVSASTDLLGLSVSFTPFSEVICFKLLILKYSQLGLKSVAGA